jgi:hypothetical protein
LSYNSDILVPEQQEIQYMTFSLLPPDSLYIFYIDNLFYILSIRKSLNGSQHIERRNIMVHFNNASGKAEASFWRNSVSRKSDIMTHI